MFDHEQPYKTSKLLQDTSTVATQLQHHHFQHFRMPERRLGIKIIILVVFLIGLVVMLAMCRNNDDVEERQRMVVSNDKLFYALGFEFRFQIIVEGERIVGREVAIPYVALGWPRFDPFFDTLVFVHNEEEAQGFPDNVVVAWPVDNEWLQSELRHLNWRVRRDIEDSRFAPAIGVDALLRDYGLVYPITIVDLVDNWEAVDRAYMELVLRGHVRR